MLPCLAHATDETIRPAQQQNVRAERMSTGQHGQILQNDGVEERSHELIGRDTLLLQTVDVGFGKDTAFAGHLMELNAVVAWSQS